MTGRLAQLARRRCGCHIARETLEHEFGVRMTKSMVTSKAWREGMVFNPNRVRT